MNKACVYVLLLASFAVTGCAQKIQYPEAYGTYIKDGDKFSRLEVNTPQEAQRNFTASASIVVFDRLLASPLVQPKEAITLFNRHYVRFNVDLVQLKAEGEIVERHISKAGDFANLGSSLGLDVYPVPGHPDMLEFKPVGNFRAGLYTLLVDQQQYAFAIGLGGKTDAESEHNGMVDRYFEVTPKRGGFTFEEFGKASERGPFANNYRDNYFIQKEYYKSSAALDGEVRQWRENFENNIKSQNYLGCMNIIECLDAFDGTGQALKAGLLDSMAAGLRKDLDIDPLFVAARSAQFMRMEPLVQAFRDINEIATKRIKEINAKSSKPTDEERKTRLLNSILYVSQPLPQGNEKELIGKLEIFEDGIVDHFYQDGVPKKFVTDLAGISIGAHSDFRHIRGFFDEHPKQYYVLEFSKSGANGSYHFHSARERDDASTALQKAVDQFKSKLDLHDKVTAGNVSMEIDGDTMVYVVKSVPYLWSPVINLPDNCAGVYWKQVAPKRMLAGSDEIEIQLPDEKVVDKMRIPSGQSIRIRSAKGEGEITGQLCIVLGPVSRPIASTLNKRALGYGNATISESSPGSLRKILLENDMIDVGWKASKSIHGRTVCINGGFNKNANITGEATVGQDGGLIQLKGLVDAAAIWTESDTLTHYISERDAGFFDRGKHPMSQFVSTAIRIASPSTNAVSTASHTIEGEFQFNGISKTIAIPARIESVGDRLRVFARFKINRQMFNCRLVEAPTALGMTDDDISSDIEIILNVDTSGAQKKAMLERQTVHAGDLFDDVFFADLPAEASDMRERIDAALNSTDLAESITRLNGHIKQLSHKFNVNGRLDDFIKMEIIQRRLEQIQ